MKKLLIFAVLFILSCSTEPEDCAGEPGGSAVCGCNNENAVNYDSTATNDDGSCIFDTTEPSIQFTSPNPNDTLGGIITLRVEAQDDYEITKVEFKVEDDSLFTDTEEPYEYEWDSIEYEYAEVSFSARAYDGQNDKDIHLSPVYIDNRPEPVNVTSVEYVWNEGPEYIVQWEESADTNFQEYIIHWINNWNGHGERSVIDTISDRTTTSHVVNISDSMRPTDRNWFWVELKNSLGFTNIGEASYNEPIGDPVLTLQPISVENDSITITWSRSTALGNEYYQLFESTSANITSGFTRYWYPGVGGMDTTITVPMLEEEYGGSETMFYQVHVFAPFNQEAVSNIMPLYLNPCGVGEVNIWGHCRNIEETTSIHHNEPGWSWLGPHPRGPIPAAIGELVNLTELIVEHSPLDGPIPPEIGNLTNLTHLEFWNTNLTGPLPSEIGNLVNLEHLILDGNRFTGTIPSEIGNLTALKELGLANSWDNEGLTDPIPFEIGNMYDLEYLNLSNNQFSTIPSEIGNLSELKEMYISGGMISSIPGQIGNLINLERLDLNDNEITSLPSGIGELVSLTRLGLDGNQISILPGSIGNLTNLQSLLLSDNNLISIPSEIGGMVSLVSLDIDGNELTEIPLEFCDLPSLEDVDFRYNPITTIPSEIGNLTNLKWLDLHRCDITSIPPEIGNLVNLEMLNLSWNESDLTGEIPVEIGNLANLKQLFLEHNNLTGSIPSEIGNLVNLEKLYLNSNILSGLIPESLCSLDLDIRIWDNALCPPYPSCIEENIGNQNTENCD